MSEDGADGVRHPREGFRRMEIVETGQEESDSDAEFSTLPDGSKKVNGPNSVESG